VSGAGARAALKLGLIGGGVAVYCAAVGLVGRFESRAVITGVIGLGRLLFLIIAVVFGYVAARPRRGPGEPVEERDAGVVAVGAIAGAVTGAVTGALVVVGSIVNLRAVFVSLSDATFQVLTFGQPAGVGALLLILVGALLGALGASAWLLTSKQRGTLGTAVITVLVVSLFSPLFQQILFSLFIPTDLIYSGDGLTVTGAVVVFVAAAALSAAYRRRGATARARFDALPERQQKAAKIVGLLLVVALLLYLPFVLGIFLSEVVGTIGLFVLLGLGLNIVVGYAGLLDLGYVAFFAIGAYTAAILTTPGAFGNLEMDFWAAIPVVVIVSTVCGVLIGAPVLRLRGDYLAIVTLGFGEIARIIVISNWAAPLTGGAQGIVGIPDPAVAGTVFDSPQTIYYPILIACLLAAFISARLQDSRVGRAWSAMREDEQVAEAMGISIIKYKLLAFGMGAAIGCLSGAFFAAKIGSVFPASFNLLVSIQVLALIVLGGMGNIWGVVVGAAVLVGLPELLREYAEFRLLFYGATLVAIMLLKPEGLVPSARRRRELGLEEPEEEQYEERAGEAAGAPVLAGGSKQAG
jgi:branched-chain amino acid transport system permease protein